jgi:two-component system, NtrC family, sensor kinase
MSLSTSKAFEAFKHPAARVDIHATPISANEKGLEQLELLVATFDHLEEYLHKGKPFKWVLDNGMLLQGLPVKESSDFLLEWHKLPEAEIRLALFQAVSKSVNSSLILEEIFDSLGEVLRAFIPFESASIVILDESQNSTKVIVSLDNRGQAEIRGDNTIFAGYDTLIDELLKKQQSKLMTAPMVQSILVEPTCRQAIVVPLNSKGLVIGCIGLSGERYLQTHVTLLEEVSEQLAVAVENARLFWQTQRQAAREFLINQITKAIRQSLEITEILETTVQEVGRVMGLSRCLIHYWEAASESFQHFEYVIPGTPHIQDPEDAATFERNLFLNRQDPLQQYNPFILNDYRTFEDGEKGLLEKEEIKSLAVFPMLLQETTFVGTISLHQCNTYRSWLSDEIELLKAIAEHVGVALHQANLFQEKEKQRQKLENTLVELQQTQMHLIQSEKMAVLGQFVAGIAHEVNTPLGTIMSNDDTVTHCVEALIVEDESQVKFHQTALDLLKINRMAGERIQEIVKNLRNFARLDESDLKQADLHDGLDSTLLLMQGSLKGTIRIIKEYGKIPMVECFPGLLNQVFMNILINATHSIENHGAITIKTTFDEAENKVSISFQDTGKGIPAENLSRIFDPGFTTKGVGVGTGLGLALCYKIMEKHHGRIEVESQVGHGTAMTVILPISPESRSL